jgi:tRNA (guanine-N7-)-methyltransferase
MGRLRRRRHDAPARSTAGAPPPPPLYVPPAGTSSPWFFLFGNDRPVEIEIGPGRGDVLLAFATARPEVNFFAIEHVRGAEAHIATRLHAAGLRNARVLGADAACVIEHLVPAASVAAYHVYFPDPWPKQRHRKRRLVTARLAAAMARTLSPAGTIHVATDLGALFDDIGETLAAAGFTRRDDVGPARPTTRFEAKYAAAGTFAGTFSRTA